MLFEDEVGGLVHSSWKVVVCGLLNVPAKCKEYLRDKCAATLRQKVQVKLAVLLTDSVQTPGQSVLALVL